MIDVDDPKPTKVNEKPKGITITQEENPKKYYGSSDQDPYEVYRCYQYLKN